MEGHLVAAALRHVIEAGLVASMDDRTPLEELDYRWPVAFGRFSIDARNPGVDWFHPDRELGSEARAFLSELSSTLGTEVTAIWQHI